ncbi:MAG: hypothetical protein D4R97_02315 [Bacteroidetes bacterium]|nr:MAG: hypothetical protein D4R97_02315 [Bacteroidota bacterium]
MKTRDAAVIVLAAGLSQRMKSPKALLPFDKQMTFIERITGLYTEWGCKEIIVVVNKENSELIRQVNHMPEAVSVVVNDHPEYERFYSVKLGLRALKSSEFCFLQNVDNPFIDKGILETLFGNRSSEAIVSPVFQNKGGHPVLLNHKSMRLITAYPTDNANLKEILGTIECKKVEMQDDKVLININSPEEYERLFDIR